MIRNVYIDILNSFEVSFDIKCCGLCHGFLDSECFFSPMPVCTSPQCSPLTSFGDLRPLGCLEFCLLEVVATQPLLFHQLPQRLWVRRILLGVGEGEPHDLRDRLPKLFGDREVRKEEDLISRPLKHLKPISLRASSTGCPRYSGKTCSLLRVGETLP